MQETQRIASSRARTTTANEVPLLLLERVAGPIRVSALQLICLPVRVVSNDRDVGLVVEPNRLRAREKLKVVPVAVKLIIAPVLLLEPTIKLLRLLLFGDHTQLGDQLLLAFLLEFGPSVR